MPQHFEYHNVDESFLAGMIEEIPRKYSGKPNLDIPQSMQTPRQMSYGPADKYLCQRAKTMRLRSGQHLKMVDKYLDSVHRLIVPTDRGYNNVFDSIMAQLHVPKKFTSNVMRHQLASYFIENVDFLYPKMSSYLQSNNLTYLSYVMGIYHGSIWGDEFIIGAIAMMFNIRITLISPYFNDLWHIFHDGLEEADIILVVNGSHFGSEPDNISHCTSTRGVGETWKCVGGGYEFNGYGSYCGHSEGRKTAIDLFTVTLNRDILLKTRKMLSEINELCSDVEQICKKRDDIIDNMRHINLTLGEFTRYRSFYTEVDEEIEVQHRNEMPVQKRSTEIFLERNFSRSIPKIRLKDSTSANFSEELVNEAIDLVKQNDNFKSDGDLSSKRARTEDKRCFQNSNKRRKVDTRQVHIVGSEQQIEKQGHMFECPVQNAMTEHSHIAEVTNRNNEEQLNTDSWKKVNNERNDFESDVEIAVIDHSSDKEKCDIQNIPELQKETDEIESDVEIGVIDHTSDVEESHIYNVSEVQKETNEIESHVEIAVIDDTSHTDKCQISIADKLETKTNKRKDDVEQLRVQKNNNKRENEAQKNISGHVKENEEITQNQQNVIDIQCLTKTEIEKLKVSVKQNVDKSKLPKPVPENKKIPGYHYCEKCGSKFKEERHKKKHVEQLCPYLTEIEKIKCPFDNCDKLFKNEKSFKDHLSAKHGSNPRFQCQKCGMTFSYQKSFSRHVKNSTC